MKKGGFFQAKLVSYPVPVPTAAANDSPELLVLLVRRMGWELLFKKRSAAKRKTLGRRDKEKHDGGVSKVCPHFSHIGITVLLCSCSGTRMQSLYTAPSTNPPIPERSHQIRLEKRFDFCRPIKSAGCCKNPFASTWSPVRCL